MYGGGGGCGPNGQSPVVYGGGEAISPFSSAHYDGPNGAPRDLFPSSMAYNAAHRDEDQDFLDEIQVRVTVRTRIGVDLVISVLLFR